MNFGQLNKYFLNQSYSIVAELLDHEQCYKKADKVKAGTVESSTWQILTLSGTKRFF